MKKLLTFIVAIVAAAMLATAAQAEEKYVGGGFEAAGHVMAGAGFQHQFANAIAAGTASSDGASFNGVLGRYLAAIPAGRSETFMFFVDDAELNLMKSFGENIRTRIDLDFGRVASASRNAMAFQLRQAYATSNIPVGNGIEFLVGRFNAPAGFESRSAVENDTISMSLLSRAALRPVGLTGFKLYYAFSDLVDAHLYVVNSLTTDTVKASPVHTPSAGYRLGFNWGEEANKSTLGISGFIGPESGNNTTLTYGGDADVNWWINDSFALGAEALFRRDNGFAGAAALHTLGGLLNVHYVFSDVWDGTLKYAFTKQYNPTNGALALIGYKGSNHEVSLAGGYTVADGAKVKLEGRFDILKNDVTSTTAYDYGAALAFAYNF